MRNLMRYGLAIVALAASVATACAQSNPGLVYGQVPTAAQWNAYFAAKQDYPIPTATTSILGLVRPDGITITIAGGVISASGTATPCTGTLNAIQYNNAGVLGCLGVGTALQVLHGNASGAATFSAVDLTTDVSGNLPVARLNGGAGASSATFWRGDGVWATPAGSGNVTGPGSAVSGNVISFNGTTGTLIQDSGVSAALLVTTTGIQTLTNKTLSAPIISSIINTGTLTLPTATDVLVARSTTDTLANKSISGSSNTLTNIANAALTNSSITIGGASTALGGTVTATTILDSISSTQGTVLYRGAATWSALAPGTAGNVLTTQGAAANPTWTAVSGTGTVTSITCGTGLQCTAANPIVGSGTITLTNTLNAQTGASYPFVAGDGGKTVTRSNAGAMTDSLSQATGSFGAGWATNVSVLAGSTGSETITPATSVIAGLSALTIAPGQGASIFSDGTNYQVVMGVPLLANNHVLANITGGTNFPVDTTLTGLIDGAIGNTRGGVLYRGASGWALLSPGTSGFFLKTLGAGADPLWATATGGSGCTTSGSSILSGDGAGGCSNVTIGSGLSFSGGTLSATGSPSLAYTATFSGNVTGTPGSTGLGLVLSNATFTDNNTAGSGTAALFAAHSIATPTLAATNSTVTTTHATTLYIAGVPSAGTNETLTATSAMTIAGGDVAYLSNTGKARWYNVGSPGVTNREEADFGWAANVFTISTAANGTGTLRQLALSSGSNLQLNAASGSTVQFQVNNVSSFSVSGSAINSSNTGGAGITNSAATSTVPVLLPNRSSGTTGWGAQASGNISGIISATEIMRLTSTGLFMQSGLIGLKSFTVAGLPTGVTGGMAYVTDATACTFAGALTGGGSTFCPVIYNGTAYQAL